ncbi:hypothetical protein M758_UG089700 [Ceratodon purpureus]|nr:hypothetical protein M758_UG089700 [Ceratodon purpureus]
MNSPLSVRRLLLLAASLLSLVAFVGSFSNDVMCELYSHSSGVGRCSCLSGARSSA